MIPKVKYYGPQIPSTYAVNMTAAGSGSNGITVADDDDIDFGTNDFFIHWEGSLPDWTPSAIQRLFFKTDGSNGVSFNVAGSASSNYFSLAINSTSYLSTVVNSIVNGSLAKVTAVVTRSSASAAGSVVFYVNGAQIGASVSISIGAPVTVSNAVSAYISGTSTTRTASNAISCIVGNFAPTAAEVLDLCTNGIPASWKWGSQAAKFTTDFSAGTNSFTGVSGVTVTGNQDAVYGVDDTMLIESNGSASARARRSNFGGNLFPKTSITIQAVRPAANVTCTGIKVAITEDGSDSVYASFDLQISAADTWQTFVIPAFSIPSPVPTGRRIAIYPITAANGTTVTSGDKVWVKALTTYQAGATMALLPDTIPTSSATTWSDTSGNTGGGTLPAAGATKVTIRR